MYARLLPILVLAAVISGCGRPGTIDVDMTTQPVRFIVDHQGWPRPFAFPRVTEFAVASEEDGLLWQLESTTSDGEPTDCLAIIYGVTPSGFRQIHPNEGTAPKPLVTNRSYFVAAAGPEAVYRMAFALPRRAVDVNRRREEKREEVESQRESGNGGFYPTQPSNSTSGDHFGG